MLSNRRYAIHAARYWYRYSCDLTHFNVWASFLLIMRPEHLCKGKPSVTAGRKAKGSQHTRDGRAARVHGAPQPERAFSLRSHRVLGRTMSDGRSPPRGNSGGFSFARLAVIRLKCSAQTPSRQDAALRRQDAKRLPDQRLKVGGSGRHCSTLVATGEPGLVQRWGAAR